MLMVRGSVSDTLKAAKRGFFIEPLRNHSCKGSSFHSGSKVWARCATSACFTGSSCGPGMWEHCIHWHKPLTPYRTRLTSGNISRWRASKWLPKCEEERREKEGQDQSHRDLVMVSSRTQPLPSFFKIWPIRVFLKNCTNLCFYGSC